MSLSRSVTAGKRSPKWPHIGKRKTFPPGVLKGLDKQSRVSEHLFSDILPFSSNMVKTKRVSCPVIYYIWVGR